LRSGTETRFIRLKSETQLVAWTGSIIVVAWTIVATAILLMDSIGAGNFRAQAQRDQLIYESRLSALSSERDIRASEAAAAHDRFSSAMQQISIMQTELLATEEQRRELETGLEVVQATLRDAMKAREEARARVAALAEETEDTRWLKRRQSVTSSQPTPNSLSSTPKTWSWNCASCKSAMTKSSANSKTRSQSL